MLDDVRRYVEAGIGMLSPSRAREAARALQGQSPQDVARVAQDLIDWSRRNRDRLIEMVRQEVSRQLRALVVATRDDPVGSSDTNGLHRVEIGGSGPPSTARRQTAKRSRAKTPPAKKSTAKKSTAKKSTAKKSTRKPTGGERARS
jgi:hypothetical protein